MAFPTGTGSTQSLAFILNDVLTKASAIKQSCSDFKAKVAAQNVLGTEVFSFLQALRLAQLDMEVRSQVPGLREYAQSIFDDNTLEIVSEFQGMNAAINNVIATINGQTPSQLTTAVYTPANTTAFRTQLQAVVDAID